MITGVFLIRHTSISLRVCVSTPFAPSTTMITLSTAVSVRYVSSASLVTRSIENIDLVVPIVKFHYGSCHRDTTLFLNLHPVGSSRFLDFITLDRTCHLNLTTESNNFSVNDVLPASGCAIMAKCSPSLYFCIICHIYYKVSMHLSGFPPNEVFRCRTLFLFLFYRVRNMQGGSLL